LVKKANSGQSEITLT